MFPHAEQTLKSLPGQTRSKFVLKGARAESLSDRQHNSKLLLRLNTRRKICIGSNRRSKLIFRSNTRPKSVPGWTNDQKSNMRPEKILIRQNKRLTSYTNNLPEKILFRSNTGKKGLSRVETRPNNKKKFNKNKQIYDGRVLKWLWHAFPHMRQLDFWCWEPFFKISARLAFGEEILFHRPWDARESHSISILELLVHFGSFKRHILFFCASIDKKIRSHWGEVHEAMFVVVSVPTDGSNVAFHVVIWL